jgi:hypothetical protein
LPRFIFVGLDAAGSATLFFDPSIEFMMRRRRFFVHFVFFVAGVDLIEMWINVKTKAVKHSG